MFLSIDPHISAALVKQSTSSSKTPVEECAAGSDSYCTILYTKTEERGWKFERLCGQIIFGCRWDEWHSSEKENKCDEENYLEAVQWVRTDLD